MCQYYYIRSIFFARLRFDSMVACSTGVCAGGDGEQHAAGAGIPRERQRGHPVLRARPRRLTRHKFHTLLRGRASSSLAVCCAADILQEQAHRLCRNAVHGASQRSAGTWRLEKSASSLFIGLNVIIQ